MINKYIQLFRRGRAVRKAVLGDSSKEWVKDTNYSDYRNNGNGTRTYRFSTYTPTEQKIDYSQTIYDILKGAGDDTFIQKIHPEWYNEDGTLNTSYKVPTKSNTSTVDQDTTDTSSVVETPTIETQSSTVQVPNTTTSSPASKKLVAGTKKPPVHDNNYFISKANNQLQNLGISKYKFTTIDQIKAFQRSIGTEDDGDFGNATKDAYISLQSPSPNKPRVILENGEVQTIRKVAGNKEVSKKFFDTLQQSKAKRYTTKNGATFVKTKDNKWHQLLNNHFYRVYTVPSSTGETLKNGMYLLSKGRIYERKYNAWNLRSDLKENQINPNLIWKRD